MLFAQAWCAGLHGPWPTPSTLPTNAACAYIPTPVSLHLHTPSHLTPTRPPQPCTHQALTRTASHTPRTLLALAAADCGHQGVGPGDAPLLLPHLLQRRAAGGGRGAEVLHREWNMQHVLFIALGALCA